MRTFRRSAVLASFVVAAFAMATTPAAVAGTLSYDGDALVFTAGDNLDHELQFRFIDGRDHILDRYDITSGPGDCQYEGSSSWVSCPPHSELRVALGSGPDSVFTGGSQGDCFAVYTIDLGDGANDSFLNEGCTDPATATITAGSGEDTIRGGSASTNVTIFGGGGADTLSGGAGNDVIHGGDGDERAAAGEGGNDQVFGEGGNDVLRGGEGNDLEDGGPGDDDIGYSPGINHDDDRGADQLRGGDGNDLLRLSGHSPGMTITLDGQANDGNPNEGDNVAADIERIQGTSGNDAFTGSAGADNFDGGSGNDEIHGSGGNDDLAGAGGDDRVFGEAGNDIVEGTNGADIVDGGPGTDQIYGDIGSCSVFCNSDPDQLFARDGERDTVDCGGGADSAVVDGLDIVAFCTVVDRQDAPGTGPGGGSPSAASLLALKVARSIKLKALLRRGLAVRLRCAAACKVAATLSYKGKRLGAGRKTLRRAGTARLAVKIGRKARQRVRRLRGKKLTLRIKVTSAGRTTTISRKVTLKR